MSAHRSTALSRAAQAAGVDIVGGEGPTALIASDGHHSAATLAGGTDLLFTHAVSAKHGLDGYYRVRTRGKDAGFVADFIDADGRVAATVPAEVGELHQSAGASPAAASGCYAVWGRSNDGTNSFVGVVCGGRVVIIVVF
jgi:hypothetical protein